MARSECVFRRLSAGQWRRSKPFEKTVVSPILSPLERQRDSKFNAGKLGLD
jgi:hypothetical protein